MVTSRWEFCNDMFQKGRKELLCEIRRRKAWANKQQPPIGAGADQQDRHPFDNGDEDQRSSSTSSSSEYSSLIDENKRLRKENGALSSELLSTKNKCRELLDLVCKYAMIDDRSSLNRRYVSGVRVSEEEGGAGGDQEEKGPKLFGVRLGEGDHTRKRKVEKTEMLLSQS